jgi:hypothetical protein
VGSEQKEDSPAAIAIDSIRFVPTFKAISGKLVRAFDIKTTRPFSIRNVYSESIGQFSKHIESKSQNCTRRDESMAIFIQPPNIRPIRLYNTNKISILKFSEQNENRIIDQPSIIQQFNSQRVSISRNASR